MLSYVIERVRELGRTAEKDKGPDVFNQAGIFAISQSWTTGIISEFPFQIVQG